MLLWRALIGFQCGDMGHLARNCTEKTEDDPSLFSGHKETATESETFFSCMAFDDFSAGAVFAEQEEIFFAMTQTLTRRKERFCSTQTLRRRKRRFGQPKR